MTYFTFPEANEPITPTLGVSFAPAQRPMTAGRPWVSLSAAGPALRFLMSGVCAEAGGRQRNTVLHAKPVPAPKQQRRSKKGPQSPAVITRCLGMQLSSLSHKPPPFPVSDGLENVTATARGARAAWSLTLERAAGRRPCDRKQIATEFGWAE